MLIDRASRFIWELRCGKKDRKLFLRTINRLCELMDRTQALSLFTDGEHRYGTILFEVCHERLTTGRRAIRVGSPLTAAFIAIVPQQSKQRAADSGIVLIQSVPRLSNQRTGRGRCARPLVVQITRMEVGNENTQHSIPVHT